MASIPSEFLAALLGATAGGAASLGGSVVVNRRELIRQARFRLHDELIPGLVDAIGDSQRTADWARAPGPRTWRSRMNGPSFDEAFEAARRAAVLAGRGALERMDEIGWAATRYDLTLQAADAGEFNEESGKFEGASGAEEALLAHVELMSAIQSLSDWVERKIL